MRLVLVFALVFLACGVTAPLPLPVENTPAAAITSTPEIVSDTILENTGKPTVEADTVTVTAFQYLNLRAEPSYKAVADGQGVKHGEVLIVLDRVPGWVKVETADGRTGWVSELYIR